MTFLDLKTRLLAILGREPPAVVYEMVTAEINRDVRLKAMQATATLAEAATVSLGELRFLEMVDIYRNTSPPTVLRPTTPQAIRAGHIASGVPREYAVVDGLLLLNPVPDGAENLVIRYYQKLNDLSADSDENDILTNYPDIYVYGALAHHAMLLGDERAGGWQGLYEDAKRRAVAADARASMGAAHMVVRAPGATP